MKNEFLILLLILILICHWPGCAPASEHRRCASYRYRHRPRSWAMVPAGNSYLGQHAHETADGRL